MSIRGTAPQVPGRHAASVLDGGRRLPDARAIWTEEDGEVFTDERARLLSLPEPMPTTERVRAGADRPAGVRAASTPTATRCRPRSPSATLTLVTDVVARGRGDLGALAMACEKHRKDRRRPVPVELVLPGHLDDNR